MNKQEIIKQALNPNFEGCIICDYTTAKNKNLTKTEIEEIINILKNRGVNTELIDIHAHGAVIFTVLKLTFLNA